MDQYRGIVEQQTSTTRDSESLGFKKIQIMRDECLGTGAYGAVYKAKCDYLTCAAKILHPTLFDPSASLRVASHRQHRLPMSRFNSECGFMSTIKHPNIVQYLGMYEDTITHLPVLLMELMDESLTKFLECSPRNSIAYHVQVNICYDITLALSFLHSNDIIHRDLSSNNILLIGNVRAKVSDFGMARLGLNPQASYLSNTCCPGADVYMPPEAVQSGPAYSEKIDCFSFGVIVVQILTQKFPDPSDRQKVVSTDDPRFPRGLKADVPEMERRQSHISKVDASHPLFEIVCQCLKDSERDRPSAQELCNSVEALKECDKYRKSVTSQNQDGESELKEQHAQEVQSLRQNYDSQLTEKSNTISVREQEIALLREQLQQVRLMLTESEEVVAQFGRRNNELESQLSQMVSQQSVGGSKEGDVAARFERRHSELLKRKASQRPLNREAKIDEREQSLTDMKLSWRVMKKAPCKMERESNAVVDGSGMVYVHCSDQEIYAYNTGADTWSTVESCPNVYCSIAIVNGLLTAVGGTSGDGNYSRKLYSFTQDDNFEENWIEIFPSMPTKRSRATALCAQGYLIVAGGHGDRVLLNSGVLSTVEVMDINSRQWSSAADLPEPMSIASAAFCNGRIYILGGNNKESKPTTHVYMCSFSALLRPITLSAHFMRMLSSRSVWSRTVFDIPVARSTCVSVSDQLLAIGGITDVEEEPSTSVYMFQVSTDSWEVVSHMNIGRCNCLAAVLPNNRLIVVGSIVTSSTVDAETVEIATLVN